MPSVDFKSIKQTDRSTVHHEIVSEWGGAVHMRLLTAAEHVELSSGADSGGKFGIDVLCRCVCDENGKACPGAEEMIRNADADQAETISRLALTAMKVNGLIKKSREDAKKN